MATAELKSRPRLPEWLRIKLPTSDDFARTHRLLDELKLHTVCESAKCPNHWECWSKGTATFMIAGDRCTRACGFCAVTTARPFALEADEPGRVAEATRRMRLRHIVITAVARDDLADGGAEHFRKTVEAVRKANPGIVIEVLVPDFNDRDESLETVLAADPHIFNHNLETVRRLTPLVRSRATYDRSLSVLAQGEGQTRRRDLHKVRDDARPGGDGRGSDGGAGGPAPRRLRPSYPRPIFAANAETFAGGGIYCAGGF